MPKPKPQTQPQPQGAATDVVEHLNLLLANELEALSRYLHHSVMVFGFSRKPIQSYFREQANECVSHASSLAELIVSLGGHPQVTVQARWEPERHTVKEMLEINLAAERGQLAEFERLLARLPDSQVALVDRVRSYVGEEQAHVWELEKYLKGTT